MAVDSGSATGIPFARGTTWHQATAQVSAVNGFYGSEGLEGQIATFRDINPTTLEPRSGRTVTCMAVRLVHGLTTGLILAKRSLVWTATATRPPFVGLAPAGTRSKRVAGFSRFTAEEVAGVGDEFLGTTPVYDGDLFWMVIDGPTLLKSMFTNQTLDTALGDMLYAVTGATSSVTGGTTSGGRYTAWNGTFAAADTTDGTACMIIRNSFARAISACSTSSTNTDTLVNVSILR